MDWWCKNREGKRCDYHVSWEQDRSLRQKVESIYHVVNFSMHSSCCCVSLILEDLGPACVAGVQRGIDGEFKIEAPDARREGKLWSHVALSLRISRCVLKLLFSFPFERRLILARTSLAVHAFILTSEPVAVVHTCNG